ncbi:RTA1-domain-containing protein [Hortaea werneckii]|nr:RTA1-domain-containing protein [Hortaea werneckii]
MAEGGVEFRLFRYYPNLGAAVLFIILFFAASFLHTYQLLATRTWFFIAFLVGGYLEAIGFIARAVAANQSPNWTVPVYSIHTIFVLVAPSVFAASIYMCLGRLIRVTDGEKHSLVPRRWLTKLFVIGDVVSFIMQGAGGGIMASGTESAMTLGENIIITGLVVQIFFFTCFVITAGLFHYRMKCCPTAKSIETSSLWKRSIHSLYVGSVLIWVRCVFRLIEYAQGNDGYLISHEVFLYVFDATLMCGVMVLFAVVHPSEINARLHGPGWKVVENGIFLHSTQGA